MRPIPILSISLLTESDAMILMALTILNVGLLVLWLVLLLNRVRREPRQNDAGRFWHAFDNILEGCQIISFDWHYLYLNDTAASYSRQPKEALLGRTVMECYPGIEATAMFATLRKCMEQRVACVAEFEFTYANGDTAWFEFSIQPTSDGLFVLTINITEKKRAAAALQESQVRLAGIIESAMDAIITVDDAQRILVFNRTAETMFRCSADDVVGQSLDRLIPARFREPHREHIRVFGKVGITSRRMGSLGQITGIRADGEEFPIEAAISYIEMAGSKYFTVILRDTTERQQAAEQLQRAHDRDRLLRDIAITANTAASIDTILQFTLDEICNYMDWEIGHAYVIVSGEKKLPRSTPSWYIRDSDCFNEFRHFTETSFDPAHTGLIHKVLETKTAQWIADVSSSPEFTRAEVARRCGLSGGYAFPVMADNEIAGVLEFYSTQLSQETAREMFDLSWHIGAQVGRVFERLWAQEQLKASDERYRAVFERSLNAIYIHDFEGRFLDANPAALDLIGYSKEEVSQLNLSSLLMPDDLDAAMQHIQQIVQQGYESQVSEYALRRKGGGMVYVETLSSVLDRDGQSWAIQGVARDITGRKRAEANLRRYTERLELLHDIDRAILSAVLPQTIAQNTLRRLNHMIPFQRASVLTFDNHHRQAQHLAVEPENSLPWQAGDTIPLDDQPAIGQLMQNQPYIVQDTESLGEFASAAEREIAASGIRSYVGVPLISGNQLLGVLALFSDRPQAFATEAIEIVHEIAAQLAIAILNARLSQQIQQHAEELEQRVAARTAELQYQSDRMETILHSSSDAILLLTQNGSIIQANHAFCATFDCEAGDISGQSLVALVRIEQVDQLQHALSRVVEEQESQRIEITAHKPDGEALEADVILSPVRERRENGEDEREIVCSLRDNTIRKRTEAELRHALEHEKELNDLKSGFVSMVSHEFRTPLAVILTTAAVLRAGADKLTSERREQKLAVINEQVRRLDRLVDDVLLIGRADSVGLNFDPKTLDVISLCSEIMSDITIGSNNTVSVQFTHEGDCAHRSLDPELFRHILQNLVSNAVKYSPTGGTVHVSLRCTETQTIVIVADEGIGIPEEDQKHLFSAFHRAKNAGSFKGTGMGLSIVKQAVERHGGTVDFTSIEGEGTTFTITLPANL